MCSDRFVRIFLAIMIGRGSREISWRNKKERNISSKTYARRELPLRGAQQADRLNVLLTDRCKRVFNAIVLGVARGLHNTANSVRAGFSPTL